MKGPDFEIPPLDPPAPQEQSAVQGGPNLSPARRARAALVVAAIGISGLGASIWYFGVATSSTRPAAQASRSSTTAPAEPTGPARQPTSSVTATTRAEARIRTCLESEESAGAARQTPPEVAPWLTFDFSPRVATESLARIARAAEDARAALGEAGPLVIHVHCDIEEYAVASNTPIEEARKRIQNGGTPYIRGREIWIYGPAFESKSSLDQRQAVYHEYFHAVQHFLSRRRSSTVGVENPLWLIEGSAEYFENAVNPRELDAFRNGHVKRRAALPPLADLEQSGGSPAIGGSGDAYTVGAVASDYLVKTYGRQRLAHDFWVALADTDWRSAFVQVFGVSVDSFYAEFEAYRRTLPP